MQNKIQIIAFVLIVAFGLAAFSCAQRPKHKADPSVPPVFVQAKPIFSSNAEARFLSADKKAKTDFMSAMSVSGTERTQLCDVCCGLKANQLIIVEYADEVRRTLSMSNVDQSFDIIFANAEKMVVNIAPEKQAYSVEKFSSFEYTQYIIIAARGFCAENDITERDFIDFRQRKTIDISD